MTKRGYLLSIYRDSFGGEFVEKPAKEARTALQVVLHRGGEISGVARRSSGQVLIASTVLALRRYDVSDLVAYSRPLMTRTDDTGNYIFSGLQPGRYVIAIQSGPSGGARGPHLAYAPGVTRIREAQEIAVAKDQTVFGANVFLPDEVGVSVSGSVVQSTSGASIPLSGQISLYRDEGEELAVPLPLATSNIGASGTFSFDNVPVGTYLLRFLQVPRPIRGQGLLSSTTLTRPTGDADPAKNQFAPTLWIDQPLSVDTRPISGLAVVAQEGLSVSGRIKFDGKLAVPSSQELARQMVIVQRADGRDLGMVPLNGIAADGSFVWVGVPPGRYAVGVFGSIGDWTPCSALVDGADRLGVPIELRTSISDVEITLVDRKTVVSGQVKTPTAQAAIGSTVFLFSTNPSHWNDASTMVSSRVVQHAHWGAEDFEVSVLPGEYYVAVLPGDAPDNWRSQSFLRSMITRASRVSVECGTKKHVLLTVTGREGSSK